MSKRGPFRRWQPEEIERLRALFPVSSYRQLCAAFPNRTFYGLKAKARELGLAKPRHIWTGADVVRLRRMWVLGVTDAELAAAFPGIPIRAVRAAAQIHCPLRGKADPVDSGIPVFNDIRAKAREMGYTMAMVDEVARSGNFFARAHWSFSVRGSNAIWRATQTLGGELYIEWND